MVTQSSSFETDDFVVPQQDVWYIRKAGWIRGPYTHADMRRFRQLGWLGRSELVSSDMRQWRAAGDVASLWEDAAATVADNPSSPPPVKNAAGSSAANVWRYSADGRPVDETVTFATLQILASLGRLSAADLVWREGWPDWRRAADVSGLLAGPPEWCTACGEPVTQRTRRCGGCGAILPGYKPPHAELCAACGILGVVLFPAFPLWLIAIFMGQHDLTEIAMGRMDPGGENAARFGLRLGTIGGVMFAAMILVGLVFIIGRLVT